MISGFVFAQLPEEMSRFNGIYTVMEIERDGARTKVFEFGNVQGKNVLAVAACAQCVPAIYTHQAQDSKDLGVPVYFNNIGLYMINYDDDSFVMVMYGSNANGNWSDYSFANFYSKNPEKTTKMNKEKIAQYVDSL